MTSVRSANRQYYMDTVGFFATVCAISDLLVSLLSQLCEAQQHAVFEELVLLCVSVLFAAAFVHTWHKQAAVGSSNVVPAKESVKTGGTGNECKHEAVRAAGRSSQPEGTTPVAQSEGEFGGSQAAHTAEHQAESPQTSWKVLRHASHSSAGTRIPTGSGGLSSKPSVIDARAAEPARPGSVAPGSPACLASMLECVRNSDAAMALKLLERILEESMDCDYKPDALQKDISSGFFKLVAGQLDNERLRRDSLNVLLTVRGHGIQPPHILQDRLVHAWESKLPEQVLNLFKELQEQGCTLSSAACQCVVADMKGSTDEAGRMCHVSVDAAISHGDACDVEEETSAVHAATERTFLRREASAFVPNSREDLDSWEYPWRMPSDTSMSYNWIPYAQYDEFLRMGLQQMERHHDENTTVILQNLPGALLREDLINEMDAKGFAGLYNFVYIPIDFQTRISKGYAFVNLVSTEEVQRFMLAFNGFRDWPVPSTKICSVDLSRTQGIERNIRLYQNSAIMGDEVPERFRPALFDGAVRVAFPEPARELQLIENQCDQRNTGLEQRCHGRRGPRSVQASVFRWDTTNPSHRAQGRAA